MTYSNLAYVQVSIWTGRQYIESESHNVHRVICMITNNQCSHHFKVSPALLDLSPTQAGWDQQASVSWTARQRRARVRTPGWHSASPAQSPVCYHAGAMYICRRLNTTGVRTACDLGFHRRQRGWADRMGSTAHCGMCGCCVAVIKDSMLGHLPKAATGESRTGIAVAKSPTNQFQLSVQHFTPWHQTHIKCFLELFTVHPGVFGKVQKLQHGEILYSRHCLREDQLYIKGALKWTPASPSETSPMPERSY